MKSMHNIPYQDSSLTVEERVEDLIARMTIEEKVAQLGCIVIVKDVVPNMAKNMKHGIGQISDVHSRSSARENAATCHRIQKFLVEETRLGIPAIIHSEALQGAMLAEATVFPSAIGLAASWDPELVREMGEVIRNQCRSIGIRQVLSPVMDVSRDARWGRINESYGESPTLSAAMSTAFVKGVQGTDLKDGVICTGKHFLGYGFSEGGINMTQCHITPRELREVFAKPFQAAISEGNLGAVMNSYCTIDGEGIVSSKKILSDLLRDEMQFNGIVVSDYMSLERLVAPLNLAQNMQDAALKTLAAGLDQELPNPIGYSDQLIELLKNDGKDYMVYIDRSVRRVLRMKFLLNLFKNPYPDHEKIEKFYRYDSYEKRSLETAKKAIVLTKNSGNILPLSKKIRSIAVVGPAADRIRALFSAYTFPAALEVHSSMPEFPDNNPDNLIHKEIIPGAKKVVLGESPTSNVKMKEIYPGVESLLEAMKRLLPDAAITTAPGCDYLGNDRSGFDEAIKLAEEAEVVILAIGGLNGWGKSNTVGEGLDSCKIGLTGVQHEFSEKILNANKKTIVVHINGRPLSDELIAEIAPAILEAWCPGPYGGKAIVSVLFGDVNPGGKLPVTIPRNVGQVPIYAEHMQGSGYEYKQGLVLNQEGYMDGTCKPLFYFGHGLSYTNFEYSDLSLSRKSLEASDTLVVTVKIKNIGGFEGDEVVQLYVRDMVASLNRPVKELVGFKRVTLKPGETKNVKFEFPLSQLAFLDSDMKWKVEAGEMKVMAGSSSEDIHLEDLFTITTDAFLEGSKRGFFAKSTIV